MCDENGKRREATMYCLKMCRHDHCESFFLDLFRTFPYKIVRVNSDTAASTSKILIDVRTFGRIKRFCAIAQIRMSYKGRLGDFFILI